MPIQRVLTPKPKPQPQPIKEDDETSDVEMQTKPDDALDNEESSTHGAFLFLCKVKRSAERSALQEIS